MSTNTVLELVELTETEVEAVSGGVFNGGGGGQTINNGTFNGTFQGNNSNTGGNNNGGTVNGGSITG